MQLQRMKCFVLMPFEDRLKEIYEQVYKVVCADNDIECWRVDEIASPGNITRDIVEGIFSADIVIADLTRKNPNVFYELGIAHSTGNKTIMTAQGRDDVPFDIASYRIIFYDHTLTGCSKLARDLDIAIKALLSALDRTNNPVQEVLNRQPIAKTTKTPLVRLVNLTGLPRPVEHYLIANKMLYAEDLAKIDLEDFIHTPGIGKTSGSALARVLFEHNLYPDVDKLTDFVIRHRLDASNGRHNSYRW